MQISGGESITGREGKGKQRITLYGNMFRVFKEQYLFFSCSPVLSPEHCCMRDLLKRSALLTG